MSENTQKIMGGASSVRRSRLISVHCLLTSTFELGIPMASIKGVLRGQVQAPSPLRPAELVCLRSWKGPSPARGRRAPCQPRVRAVSKKQQNNHPRPNSEGFSSRGFVSTPFVFHPCAHTALVIRRCRRRERGVREPWVSLRGQGSRGQRVSVIYLGF